ncbi:hypothetical protein FHU10_3783 [Serratia fonticola]|uniref:Fimbrial protein n=1 Tax=Serratia fonticola TaxID=47917 RepID=A0A542BRV1_SERFO|nr:type 1 fimbrial protein [Serratia fonticola]TQI81308.1 hypothetical protein FHU09_3924 [Serratia fonticola]TQI96668.1 hypothetical protein FHU11_2122 [Serratia fonticola]TVZ71165.1 hypothetical protein FHU10_3783 [Serratia fonticola]
MNSLRLFLIAGALFSWMAASHAGITGGVIHFFGTIVEGPCLVNVSNTTANTECYRNGKNYTGTQNLANFGANNRELPMNIGTTEMKWLDQQHKLAILTVNYR